MRKVKGKHQWCFSRLKYNRIASPDTITSSTVKNSETKVFRSKHTTNKVTANILEVSKQEKRQDICFEGQTTASKVNVTFLALINKEITCDCCN